MGKHCITTTKTLCKVRKNVNNVKEKNKLARHSVPWQLLGRVSLGNAYDRYSKGALSEALFLKQKCLNSFPVPVSV